MKSIITSHRIEQIKGKKLWRSMHCIVKREWKRASCMTFFEIQLELPLHTFFVLIISIIQRNGARVCMHICGKRRRFSQKTAFHIGIFRTNVRNFINFTLEIYDTKTQANTRCSNEFMASLMNIVCRAILFAVMISMNQQITNNSHTRKNFKV